MDLDALRGLVGVKSGAPPIVTPPSILARFEPVMGCTALAEYLEHCLPERDYAASGLRVLSQVAGVA